MSTAPSSAPAPPSPGRSAGSTRIIGRTAATIRCSPTSPTGHILRLKNRPGNVHDSKQAAAFLRDLIDARAGRLGRRLPLEFRMDAAFFQHDVLRLLAARGSAYAIKVGYWSWLPLKQLAAARGHWHALAPGVTASSTSS